METGIIPPNINFNEPRDEIYALKEGRLKVVTEKTALMDKPALIGKNHFVIILRFFHVSISIYKFVELISRQLKLFEVIRSKSKRWDTSVLFMSVNAMIMSPANFSTESTYLLY